MLIRLRKSMSNGGWMRLLHDDPDAAAPGAPTEQVYEDTPDPRASTLKGYDAHIHTIHISHCDIYPHLSLSNSRPLFEPTVPRMIDLQRTVPRGQTPIAPPGFSSGICIVGRER